MYLLTAETPNMATFDNSARSSGVDHVYLSYLSKLDWRVQQCRNCQSFIYYPRQICPYCTEEVFDWVSPSGRGSVYSTTTVCPDSDPECQYNVALIDLDEGFRMMSRVEGLPSECVRIGMRVQARVTVDSNSSEPVVVFDFVND